LNGCVCSGCGKHFDSETHRLSFVHPNLFGGVDRLCRACMKREEETHNKRINSAGRGRKKSGKNSE
jgi:hypothetical protein